MSTKVGAIAEQHFQLECLKRNIPVFVPILDDFGIDFIVKTSIGFKTIQVKSTQKPFKGDGTYKVSVIRGGDGRTYARGDFELLVVYLFHCDTFYIIPKCITDARTIRINVNSQRCRFAPFKNRWDLLK